MIYNDSNLASYHNRKKEVVTMIDVAKLRGVIAENGKTQSDVAKMIGVTPKTFYMRMQKGVFGSDEIQIMIDNLKIDQPMDIFFAKEVTL